MSIFSAKAGVICLLLLYFQNSIYFVLNKWSLFAFQEYTGFQTFKAVPYVLRYINAVCSTLLADYA